MAGITGFSAYVPISRMGQSTVGWMAKNERSVASFDEDSLTMAVAAVMNCIGDSDRKAIDAVYFASTTFPYKEKQAATTLATAVDLPVTTFCVDIANSLHAGTAAIRLGLNNIKSGEARKVLVAAADLRISQPRSEYDATLGDGGAAMVLGSNNVVAEIEDVYSIAHEIQDVWRSEEDKFVRSWEDRFVFDKGYLMAMPEAINAFLTRTRSNLKDFKKVVYSAPDARRHRDLAGLLNLDYKNQAQNSFADSLGNTGAAYSIMLLVAALEESSPGDRILFASYGNGVDVFSLKATDLIRSVKVKRSFKSLLQSKRLLPSYETYLRWRGLLDVAPAARRPALRTPSAAAMLRDENANIRLYGVRCKKCGYPQYPPQRVCSKCHTKDQFDQIRFSDKRATINTFSFDQLGLTPEPPTGVCMIDFEGGGRMMAMITDRDPNEVKVGMPVEMTFRKLFTSDGIHNYYWKCMPPR
jgi:hydroxymethylglutaryl-CoA synthase